MDGEGSTRHAPLPELCLRDSRQGLGRALLAALVFLAVGVLWLVGGSFWPGLVVTAFFGAGLVAVVVALVHPGLLVLEPHGFTYRAASGRVLRQRWDDCGEFGVLSVRGVMMVSWSLVPARRARPWSARLARAMSGVDASLPTYAGGLGPSELAVLMEAYRLHHLRGRPYRPSGA